MPSQVPSIIHTTANVFPKPLSNFLLIVGIGKKRHECTKTRVCPTIYGKNIATLIIADKLQLIWTRLYTPCTLSMIKNNKFYYINIGVI